MNPASGLLRESRGRLSRLAPAADPSAGLTGRQVAADITLAAVATVASLAIAVLATRNPGGFASISPGGQAGWRGWEVALPAVAVRTAPLAMRRFRPLTTFWLCLAACLLVGTPGTATVPVFPGSAAVDFIALVPAAYSAVVHSRYRGAALLTAPAAVAALVFYGFGSAQLSNYTLLLTLLVFMAALVVGHTARLSRRRDTDSRARLLRLQGEQAEATRQAIGQERARIASELHDVVTHNVSMMVVQAGAARRVLRTSPDEARSALLAVEESGRAAITELQHMLGLLAQPGEPEDPGRTVAQDAGPLRPQPGLDQIGPLIDRVNAAGQPVELRVRGTRRALPPGIDLAAYRVVQEALTNVIKHTGQSSATVTIDYRDNSLVVEVADDGGLGPMAAEYHSAHTLRPTPGSGRGLLGLRERVLLYGGELDAGSQPGGGWRIRARFPDQPTLAVPVSS